VENEEKATTQQEQSFMAEVKLAGINPYVDVPESVVRALTAEQKAKVLVMVTAVDVTKNEDYSSHKNTKLAKDAEHLKAIGRLSPEGWFRTTLVPLRSHPTRLYLDSWMRETARVEVGDRVQVMLRPDIASRELLIPEIMLETLNSKAKVVWEALAPSRRREILTYLNFLKTSAALERNVQKVIKELISSEG
jgi:hypothetical protein